MSLFSTEVAVTQVAEGHYQGHVHSAWNIGDKPNGGYLLSLATRALSAAVSHPDPISVTTHYLRPGIPDAPCDIQVQVLRAGRTVSTARATLSQAGKPRLEVLAAFSDLAVAAGVDTDITLSPAVIPGPDACVQRDGAAQGIDIPIRSRLDVRLHSALAQPGNARLAEISGWIRFADGSEPDARSLLLFTDTFPPSPFGVLGVVGWVPTLELTVHVRRRPAPGWIQARFTTDDLHAGRMIETGCLWDSTGALVAQSRQLGLVLQSGQAS
jgi:acyl-CoA thioesterase